MDRVLNDHSREALHALVAANFVDHHPIVFGNQYPDQPVAGSLTTMQTLIEALDHPSADLTFHLEDAFATGDRVAYRLFGSGQVEGPAVPVTLLCESVGIFRIENDRLAERWGPISVAPV
ncbi:MAG: nuclear transport factor 2 family protein [Actinomycetota bacterium]|nr:nuclear transport factor 2 family protein [Actinomycetota bacterium]